MKDKIDWKRKLSSRKFWMSVGGLVTGVIALFEGTLSIEGVILALGSVVSYIFGEGWVDKGRGETNE